MDPILSAPHIRAPRRLESVSPLLVGEPQFDDMRRLGDPRRRLIDLGGVGLRVSQCRSETVDETLREVDMVRPRLAAFRNDAGGLKVFRYGMLRARRIVLTG